MGFDDNATSDTIPIPAFPLKGKEKTSARHVVATAIR